MNNDFKIPSAVLSAGGILDFQSFLSGLRSVQGHLPKAHKCAAADTLNHLEAAARKYPDGVAPRDISPKEAEYLILLTTVAIGLGAVAMRNLGSKN